MLAAALASPGLARAADTLEPFDEGLSDFELYTAFEGLGLPLADQTRCTTASLGYGLAPRLSLYLAPSYAANGYLGEVDFGLEVGALGTPVDTDHFDLDLGVSAAASGATSRYSELVELTFDLEPDLALAGVYLRATLDLFGATTAGHASLELGSSATLGGYVTLSERDQVLTELDVGWSEGALGRPECDVGGLHLGYNHRVLDHVELIHEASVDLPAPTEDWAFGFFIGVIAGLP